MDGARELRVETLRQTDETLLHLHFRLVYHKKSETKQNQVSLASLTGDFEVDHAFSRVALAVLRGARVDAGVMAVRFHERDRVAEHRFLAVGELFTAL